MRFLLMLLLLAVGNAATAVEFPKMDDWKPNWLNLGAYPEFTAERPRIARWLTEEMIAEGWIQLDNDDSLFGWQATNDNQWQTMLGKGLVCSKGEPGWLMTTTQWTDFELLVDITCQEDANGGVFIRSTIEPTDPAKDCYEINIAPESNPFPSGSIVAHQRCEQVVSKADRGWIKQRLHIIANGPRIQVSLNGKQIVDFTDESTTPRLKGHIGLQYKEGVVVYNRVLLKPLNTKPIFNGKDLAGWNTDLAGPAKISVTDAGEMQILGGLGQAESAGKYGDFVMQFECKVNGDGLNSGVFFRSIPGDKMNGYECQISNATEDGDITQPKDCGTGGIFRRQNARFVNASDHEWFTTTIHADGPHIATWVNGLQVADWTDTRKADPNPRRGLRLAPGTFCLQAHDPTTDLLFRQPAGAATFGGQFAWGVNPRKLGGLGRPLLCTAIWFFLGRYAVRNA